MTVGAVSGVSDDDATEPRLKSQGIETIELVSPVEGTLPFSAGVGQGGPEPVVIVSVWTTASHEPFLGLLACLLRLGIDPKNVHVVHVEEKTHPIQHGRCPLLSVSIGGVRPARSRKTQRNCRGDVCWTMTYSQDAALLSGQTVVRFR